MSIKEEYTAIDMATAAADGFRDGQRAAQSAPAGEREACSECNGLGFGPFGGCGECCGSGQSFAAQQRTQAVAVPEAKVTGAWESARIGDFNAGWNACRDSVFTLMKKAAYMELDTTKRSIATQDELRALLAAQPQASAAQSAPAGEREAFEAKYEQAKAVVFDSKHNRYVPRHDSHWQRQCAEAMTTAWRAFQAGAAWQRTQAAVVSDGWRDALQKIARHAPPVNCAAKTEVEKLALIAGHALIACSAPQFSKPTDHQSAKVGTAAPAQPAAQDRGEVQRLRDALEEIADPIKFMRARLEDGEQLNGVYAIQMAESGNYLREIAKRALTASTEQEVEK